MECIKAVIVSGSPRSRSNSLLLAEKASSLLEERGVEINYPIILEPELREVIIKAETSVAEQIERNLFNYLDRETERIKNLIITKLATEERFDVLENLPIIRIIIEVPPSKELMRRNFTILENIKDVFEEIKRYKQIELSEEIEP